LGIFAAKLMHSTDTGLVYEVSFNLTYTGAGEFQPYRFESSYNILAQNSIYYYSPRWPASQSFSTMGTANDLLSTISSVVSAVMSLFAILSVYLAVLQLLSQRQTHRLKVMERAFGPWISKVASSSLLRMRITFSTPRISLPKLVASKWEPNFTFPLGFSRKSLKTAYDPEADPVRYLAEASWVNFLEALGLTPESDSFYEMQPEADLVNGIAPMNWKGKELVAICSILGFQSNEDKPNFLGPMPLPMQWSGPLGWLQFSAGSGGCIVAFRRRMVPRNQLSHGLHEYYRTLTTVKPRSPCLVSRLWLSINAMYLQNDSENATGEVLYMGGMADRYRKDQDDELSSIDEIFEVVMESDTLLPDEDIKKLLRGKKSNRSEAPDSILALLSDLSKKTEEGKRKDTQLEVLNPSPGLLSKIAEGEFAVSRGLDIFGHCHEYERTYTDPENVEATSHPYNISGLCMDQDTLKLLKRAILQLRPDGFYFIASPLFCADHRQIRSHVDKWANSMDLRPLFSTEHLEAWRSATINSNNPNNHDNQLYNAMVLCNELLNIKKTSQAMFTIDEMKLISQASESLRQIVKSRSSEPIPPLGLRSAGLSLVRTFTFTQWRSPGLTTPERSWLQSIPLLHMFPRKSSVRPGKVVQPQASSSQAAIGAELPSPTIPDHANSEGTDLIWAITTSPSLFSDLVSRIGRMELKEVLTANVNSYDGVLDCASLLGGDARLAGQYQVYLMPNGTFSGVQVMAAFLDVFLTYFWIDKGFPSNTYLYDASIPQSVRMC
jgi:hypothetical protein